MNKYEWFGSPFLPGSEFQDMEVHLRRQKSGFGFRVLGGDEVGQPVSPETREKARMEMGVEPCHFLLSNPLHRWSLVMVLEVHHPVPCWLGGLRHKSNAILGRKWLP